MLLCHKNLKYLTRLDFTLDTNEDNYISNGICTIVGSTILSEMRFDNYISSQIKLNKLTK